MSTSTGCLDSPADVRPQRVEEHDSARIKGSRVAASVSRRCQRRFYGRAVLSQEGTCKILSDVIAES